ncbi:hypothetical protein AB7W88_20685, partial [Providencia vermicola]
EWVHVQLHQQKGMISLSPPTICNSAVLCLIALNGQFYSVSFDMYLLSFRGHYDFALKYAQVLDQSFD